MFSKKNSSIFNNLFSDSEKLYSYDRRFHSTNQKGRKRSHESLSSTDNNDIVDLKDSNDDSEQ